MYIKKRKSKKANPTITVISRIVNYKRIDVALKAFSIVSEKHPALKMNIIGSGAEEERLKGLSKNLAIDNKVIWHGFVKDHAEVMSILADSDIYLTASEVEGFGITTIEAAALGIPYVATDIPAIRFATQDGKGGLLFKPGSSEDCAEAINRLIEDKDLYSEKSKHAKELISLYTPERLGPKFESLLISQINK